MKIKSVTIAAFGGLKDFHIDFCDGFNAVYGENENGKSTVMAFIKMMFYGSGRANTQISKDIRKKYTPWDGSTMAGTVEFTHGGRNYRLQREFGKSNSTDRINLRDLDFGLDQNITGGDVGSKFFGLSAAAFERSVFIGQFGGLERDDAAAGEINGKLSNLALTGNETVSFDAVKQRLEKAKFALMSKSGRAGEYDKNVVELKRLEERIAAADEAAKAFSLAESRIEELRRQILSLEGQCSGLRQTVESEQLLRKADKLKELLKLKGELEQIRASLSLSDGGVVDEGFINSVNFGIAKIEKTKDKISAKESELETIKSSIEMAERTVADMSPERQAELEGRLSELNGKKQELENEYRGLSGQIAECESRLNKDSNAHKERNNLFLAAFILLVMLGVMLAAASRYVLSAVPFIGAAISLVLFFVLPHGTASGVRELENRILNLRATQSRLKADIAVIISETGNISARLEMASNAVAGAAEILNQQRGRAELCANQLNSLRDELERDTSALLKLYHRFNRDATVDTIYSEKENLANRAAQIKSVKTRLNYVSADLGNISYEQGQKLLEEMGDYAAVPTPDFERLRLEYDSLCNKIASKKSELAVAESQLKNAARNSENPALLKSERRRLLETVESQKKFCEAAECAISVLDDSFAEVRRSYGSALERKAAEIFSRITGGRYQYMNISKSLDIKVEQAGLFGSREIDYLSSGAADQAYLSLRLALSSLISETGEELPVLLDDTLTQYDDTRMKQTVEFLKEYSGVCQIIMFTCHQSVFDAAKKFGAAAIQLPPRS